MNEHVINIPLVLTVKDILIGVVAFLILAWTHWEKDQ